MHVRGYVQAEFRRRKLIQDCHGKNVWQVTEWVQKWPTEQTALVICDVWDKHWCRGANQRMAELLPLMEEFATAMRSQGVLIVHAPSETMDFYQGTPARERVLRADKVAPPTNLPHADPPLPFELVDGGCDTPPDRYEPPFPWTRQHPAITIDQERDAISDSGEELHNLYQQRNIRNIFIMGVHTNICVLKRSFGIKQMVRWGYNVALVRDLTDAMCNPADPPYVSHEEGTDLTVQFIEKFWCPSVAAKRLLGR